MQHHKIYQKFYFKTNSHQITKLKKTSNPKPKKLEERKKLTAIILC